MIRRNLIILLILLNSFFLYSKEYGLVLAGGGGKGAYQVGVWKALTEYGIAQKVTAISGASVGGLNAALFATESLDIIEKLWVEEVPVALVNDNNPISISQTGLEQLINNVNIKQISNCLYPRIYVDAVRNSDWKLCYFELNKYQEKDIKQLLLATSAAPLLCDKVFFENDYYFDGGGLGLNIIGNNVPWEPIEDLWQEAKFDVDTIIIVFLKDYSLDYENLIPGYEVIPIVPSAWLGGVISGTTNFTQPYLKKLIDLGYQDTIKILQEKGYYPVSDLWFE